VQVVRDDQFSSRNDGLRRGLQRRPSAQTRKENETPHVQRLNNHVGNARAARKLCIAIDGRRVGDGRF
jgi:hypothetical protein